MSSFFPKKFIREKTELSKNAILFFWFKVKSKFADKYFIRKLIVIVIATGICIAASAWLTSKSSMGTEYYTYIGFLLSIIASLLLAPFLLNYAIESAKARSPGWSYIIGAKVGSWLGLFISLIVDLSHIIVKQKWLLVHWNLIIAEIFFALISGLALGAIIGLLLVPILRLTVYGTRIIKNHK